MNQELESVEDAKNPYQMIDKAKKQFISIAKDEATGINYEKESMFAYQALVKNDFTLKTALNNPKSVFNAVINIASVGLSLNPATSYAYLVPRDKAICLDISYQGLIKIATDSGSIMWAKADMVFENDDFKYHGPAAMPEHTADPFGERGDFKGVYCIAKTHDGDYLVETIAADEILRIRDESASIKYAKSESMKNQSPWVRYFGEMAKKACIKRASKTWPKTEQHERIQKAIEVIHETEGSDWEPFTREEREQFDLWIEEKNGAALVKLMQDDAEKYNAIYWAISNEIPRGGKGKFKTELGEITEKTNAMLTDCHDSILAALGENNEGVISDVLGDLDEIETDLLKRRFDQLQIEQIEQVTAEL